MSVYKLYIEINYIIIIRGKMNATTDVFCYIDIFSV